MAGIDTVVGGLPETRVSVDVSGRVMESARVPAGEVSARWTPAAGLSEARCDCGSAADPLALPNTASPATSETQHAAVARRPPQREERGRCTSALARVPLRAAEDQATQPGRGQTCTQEKQERAAALGGTTAGLDSAHRQGTDLTIGAATVDARAVGAWSSAAPVVTGIAVVSAVSAAPVVTGIAVVSTGSTATVAAAIVSAVSGTVVPAVSRSGVAAVSGGDGCAGSGLLGA
ncbi:MAG: hypothetical protein WA966_02035, partial [Ornithinimicrobium sp.]